MFIIFINHLKGGNHMASYEHLYDQTVFYNGEETPVIDLTAAELTELGPVTLNSPDRAAVLETARAQAAVAADPNFEDIDSRRAYEAARPYIHELGRRAIGGIDVAPPIAIVF
jgi:hypothetical protein